MKRHLTLARKETSLLPSDPNAYTEVQNQDEIDEDSDN